jgi:hypothetical protein
MRAKSLLLSVEVLSSQGTFIETIALISKCWMSCFFVYLHIIETLAL